MSSHPNRKWRRTTITQRDGSLAPLPDNWSLIDLETGVAVAQLYKDTGYEDRPAWRVICRSMNEDGELKDIMMTWIEDPTKAREYAEGQTNGMRYVIKRKRTKEEILGRPPKKWLRMLVITYLKNSGLRRTSQILQSVKMIDLY